MVNYFRFMGEEGSLGLKRGAVYKLRVERQSMLDWLSSGCRWHWIAYSDSFPQGYCPYRSIHTFYDNFHPLTKQAKAKLRLKPANT